MKRITVYSALLLAAFAVLIAAASRSGRRDGVGASNLDGRTVLYYVDPMHPSYKSDKPGVAPDCGMTLEPVYEGSPQAMAQSRAGRANARGGDRAPPPRRSANDYQREPWPRELSRRS